VAPTAGVAKLRVAMVLPGSISDQSFNAMAYAGLMAIKDELGAEVAYSEAVPVAEFDETYRSYSEQGYNIIIGHGFEFGEPAAKIAPEFPDIYYLVTNGNVSGPNVASLEPLFEEASFLAGALAGYMTKSNKVAAVGGMEFPIIVRGIEAFAAGAKYANPQAEGTTIYIGTLDDPAKGKEAALAQISTGADVVFHIADNAGVGVIQACQEKGVYAVGFGADQNSLAPETVLTTFSVSYPALMVEAVRRIQDGKFEGTIQAYGLAVKAVDLTSYHGLVPDDVAGKIELLRQDIIDGKVEIPRVDVPPQK
jgi:basic membrane lipoprotein Med (substrate-binding protein (PBP1-ABC) superfamily)